jgi:predicted dehydrogenase
VSATSPVPAEPIRVGVLGCGQIAQIMHLPFLAESPDFTIAAVCDLSASTAEAMARRYGARVAADGDALMADPDLDAIVICSYDHAAPAIAALDAGKHVLIEKPLAFTPEEGRAVLAAEERSGLVAMVGYMKLFDPGFLEGLRRFADAGEHRARTVHDFAGRFDIAKTMYDQERFDDAPADVLRAGQLEVERKVAAHLGPHAEHADLYTLLLMLAAHDLSVVRAAFGAPDRVAYASTRDPKHLLAVLEYDDAAAVVFEMGTGTKYDWWDEWVGVTTDTGEVRVAFSHPYVRYAPTTVALRETRSGMGAESVLSAGPDDPFRLELRHFAAAIRTGADPVSRVAGALADLELATDIIRRLPVTAAATTKEAA